MIRNCFLVFILLTGLAFICTAQELQIYFIDVEGGQSTLIITPSHQSLLVDAGFPGGGGFEAKPGDPRRGGNSAPRRGRSAARSHLYSASTPAFD